MKQITIKEVLERTVDATDCYLYVYRDGDTIFYVGQSIDPIERFLQHLGIDRRFGSGYEDSVGQVIRDNEPASLEWIVELYTLAECQELVAQHKPHYFEFYKRTLKALEAHDRDYDKSLVDIAEETLIDHFRPCLNVIGRTYQNLLPGRYVKRKIANEGVKISSSQYLDI